MGILLGICYILFLIFLPLYDKAYWPEPTKKSLSNKIVAATMFVAIGVIGMFMSGNITSFSKVMIIGLVCGWFGDILMHIPSKKNMTCLYIGAAGFLVGHIFYVYAFVNATASMVENYKFFTVPEFIIFLVIIDHKYLTDFYIHRWIIIIRHYIRCSWVIFKILVCVFKPPEFSF